MPNEFTTGPNDHLRNRQEVGGFKGLPPLSRAKLATLACHTSSCVDTGDPHGLPSVPVSVRYKPFRPSGGTRRSDRLRLQIQTARFRHLHSHFQTL